MAEEYRPKTMKTTGPKPSPLYIKKPVISQLPYLRRIFPNPYLSIKPSTLMTRCNFFIYPYMGDLSHNRYKSFSREITCVPTVRLPYSFLISMMCHDFHLYTHFLLSSKRPNTRSNHDMALSYLILSYLFTLQSHTIKTRKADNIEIPTRVLSTKRKPRPTRSPYRTLPIHQSPTRHQLPLHCEAKSCHKTANLYNGRRWPGRRSNLESHWENQCREEEAKPDERRPPLEQPEEDWSTSRPSSPAT